jgi:SAM-dependent methyltransferase
MDDPSYDARPAPPLHAVDFGDLRRTTPVMRNFGFERGQPVDRYYIERFLNQHASSIAGRVLEVGDDAYTRRFGQDAVSQCDVLHVSGASPGATIVGDLASAPQIPSGTFDCVICTQTLQLIYDLRAAVDTLYRVLAPGGVLLATFPGISQIDDNTWASSWYWNLTPISARRLFGDQFGAGNIEVAAHGNVFTAICFLHGLATAELRADELEFDDPAFPFLITVVARKTSDDGSR